tara:strand:+ start:793 stop:963 length:171 start_codon:yes stop_codon:yes gene_type:complete
MYYTAVEENDTLTIMDEFDSIFEATCSFYNLLTQSGDEIELGQFVNDDMIPMIVAS